MFMHRTIRSSSSLDWRKSRPDSSNFSEWDNLKASANPKTLPKDSSEASESHVASEHNDWLHYDDRIQVMKDL